MDPDRYNGDQTIRDDSPPIPTVINAGLVITHLTGTQKWINGTFNRGQMNSSLIVANYRAKQRLVTTVNKSSHRSRPGTPNCQQLLNKLRSCGIYRSPRFNMVSLDKLLQVNA